MTFNSQEIIQDIHKDFENMLEYVTGEQARRATADDTERGLFKMLMQMGFKLLRLFFIMRSQAASRKPLKAADGNEWPYHREMQRTYFSIFGKVGFMRPYFYRKGAGGRTPLDEELSLGEDCYSDLVREIHDYLSVYGVYHKSCDILERVLGLRLSTRVVQTNLGEDAAEVAAYYAQKPAPPAEREANILVIQADGKGIPMILEKTASEKARLGKGEKHGRKKEAVVTTVYTIDAFVRTPEQVVASYYDKIHAYHPPKPQNKYLWATLDGKDIALDRLAKQVTSRLGDHLHHKIALCDGCEALQSRIAKQFCDFTLILDFIHANEYLWKVANVLLGETNEQRFEWMKAHTLQLLSGQTEQLIAEFRCLANQPKMNTTKRTQLLKTANYFERNLPFMNYPVYLSKGWPIASGVIEGACRHFVKDRCELSGMRWLQTGAENLLHLRAVAENDDWEDYHLFRKQQRHLRLYGTQKICPGLIESQSLNLHSPPVERFVANSQSRYPLLPLAS